MYTLLRAIYPGILLLRMADSNKLAMDQIYYLTHRMTTVIHKSIVLFNNEDLFMAHRMMVMIYHKRRRRMRYLETTVIQRMRVG